MMPNHSTLSFPKGCDTFVSVGPEAVVFGKNSDRPAGEAQSMRRYKGRTHAPGSSVACTYIQIPQATKTYATLISQIDWMWGCEHGANECGVVIGNEAVWTQVPFETQPALLGMDLVRLGLERGDSARNALQVITDLLETHGQGGACAENDPSFQYHNSFLIADRTEAWILETAGRHWVAERVMTGSVRNISNNLTIRTSFDLHSSGIHEYALAQNWWNGQDPFDFAAIFSQGGIVEESPLSRQVYGAKLLASELPVTVERMKAILRDHESGICMHGSFETTASMVSELGADGRTRHWTTGPYPCKSEYKLEEKAFGIGPSSSS